MLEIRLLSSALGAEIHGVDLSGDLAEDLVGEIRRALLRHLVVFFRDQRLEPAHLVAFARRFGRLSHYPFVAGMPDQPEVVEIVKNPDETVNFGGLWHTDTSYLPEPPLGSVLYAKEVPAVGGDTLFANMYMAYEALSDDVKECLEGRRGINAADKAEAASTRVHRIAERPSSGDATKLVATHPILRTHPETGRKALYCSAAHTVSIEGMDPKESKRLLEHLYEVQQRPQHCCRFHWEVGSVAFWDNRCTQHNALNDYQGYRRVMHRTTIAGDSPR